MDESCAVARTQKSGTGFVDVRCRVYPPQIAAVDFKWLASNHATNRAQQVCMGSGFFVWLNQQPPGTASFIGAMAGSTLGFLALLAGAPFNARLNRLRDDRQRQHVRTALATALCAELQLTREILVENCAVAGEPNQGDGFFRARAYGANYA
jgi:hypothetical protein